MNDDHRRPFPGTFSTSNPMSPYLNIDPSIFKKEPQFIMPEGASPKRGRFEYAFSQIGGSVMLGSAIGGSQGLIEGLRDKTLTGPVYKNPRIGHLLTAVGKYSSSTAGSLGIIALLYSGIGTCLSAGRGADDEINTLVAGTSTGLIFRLPAGLMKAGIGGAVGFGLAAAYCLIVKEDLVMRVMNKLNPKRW